MTQIDDERFVEQLSDTLATVLKHNRILRARIKKLELDLQDAKSVPDLNPLDVLKLDRNTTLPNKIAQDVYPHTTNGNFPG